MAVILFYIVALMLVAVSRLETNPSQLVFIGSFVLVFIYYFLELLENSRVRISTTQYLVIFFITYMFFNSFVAVGNDILLIDWMNESRKYLILLLIFPFTRFLNQPRRFEIAIITYIFTASFIAIYVILWWLLFKGDSATAGISSTMPIWAFIMLISIIAGHSDKKIGKPLLYFCAVCFFLYIFAEGRRTAIIIVITGAIVSLYIAGKAQSKIGSSTGRHRKIKTILVLILLVPIIYGLINTNTRFSVEKIEKSMVSRGAISYPFILIFMDNPVLGIGNGYKRTDITTYKDIVVDKDKSVHNLYINILAHSGIVGLFLFLLFYFSVLRDAYRAIYSSRATSEIFLFSGFVGVLVSLLIFFAVSSKGARFEVFTLIVLIASISNNQILNYKFNKIKDK